MCNFFAARISRIGRPDLVEGLAIDILRLRRKVIGSVARHGSVRGVGHERLSSFDAHRVPVDVTVALTWRKCTVGSVVQSDGTSRPFIGGRS